MCWVDWPFERNPGFQLFKEFLFCTRELWGFSLPSFEEQSLIVSLE
jgi:hypothetical protein